MRRIAAVALVIALPPVGCSEDPRPSARPSSSPSSPTAQARPGNYVISDEKVVKEKLVDGAIRWAITLDAEWTGTEEPDESRCVFITYRSDGERNYQAASLLAGPGDDVRLGELYPDEVAGVPTSVTITCS